MYAVDYAGLAAKAVELASTFQPLPKEEPKSAADVQLDFDLPPTDDKYLYGNFVDGTHAGKLESEVEGEQGLYNVALDPSPRTHPAFIFPTKGFHEQSAPLRPGYLLHAHRLIVALEKEVKGEVVFIYDCGERSGAIMAHKCLRGYVVDGVQNPSLPFEVYDLPEAKAGDYTESSKDDPLLIAFTDLLGNLPLKPSYNLILSRSKLYVVNRNDDGFLGNDEGRWDGARLIGIPL